MANTTKTAVSGNTKLEDTINQLEQLQRDQSVFSIERWFAQDILKLLHQLDDKIVAEEAEKNGG